MMTNLESSTEPTPSVWVGCLSCYNDGRLQGEWVEALEAGAFVPCTRAGHEEWWCLDHEGFGGLIPGECSPLEAQSIAEVLEELAGEDVPRAAFAAWCGYTGTRPTDDDAVSECVECYRGEWDTRRDFAMEEAESMGFEPGDSWPAYCVDWDYAARDLFSGSYWSTDGGPCYVFEVR